MLLEASPVQVCRQKTQRCKVGSRKLAQQLSDSEDYFLQVGARPILVCTLGTLVSAPLLRHSLGLFGQSDEVVVVAVEDERLR